jgi:membrane associated rhomboid family serine protease
MNPAEYLSMLGMIIAVAVLSASRRQTTLGWPEAAWATLLLGGVGYFTYMPQLMAASVAIAGAGLLAPAIIFSLARRWAGQGRYDRAARLGTFLAAVRRSPQMDRWVGLWAAMAAYHAGDSGAVDRLRRRLASEGTPSALIVLDGLAVLARDWGRARYSPAIEAQSRALCELGDVSRGVETIGPLLLGKPSWQRIRRMRGMLLAPLAFAGRVGAVEALTRLMRLRAPIRALWRATALAAADRRDEAEAAVAEAERHAVPPAIAAAIAARKADLPRPQPLSAEAEGLLDTAEAEVKAGLRLRPRAVWRDWGSLLLVGTILWFFWRQVQLGSGSDPRIAWMLGALEGGAWPADARRLLYYGGLHIGAMHLSVNLLAIITLGPIVSDALGRIPMLVVFLASVIGGGIAVVYFGSPGITVGASGGAMGLLGALVAILYLHPGIAHTLTGQAGARFGLGVIIFQSVFDVAMPEISFASHGGGALAGAATTAAIIGIMRLTVWRPRSA